MKFEPIFDEWNDGIGGDETTTSSVGISTALAASDQLQFQVNLSVGATSPTSFVMTIYHSQDGFRWFSKYADPANGDPFPVIVATSFVASHVNVLSFGEPWPSLPSMRFVRVQFVYQGPGTRIVIYDTSRQRTNRARANEEECNACASTEGFPAHIRVLHGLSPAELSTLQRAARAGAGRSRAAVREQLAIVGADTEARFHRSLNRAALEILSGSD